MGTIRFFFTRSFWVVVIWIALCAPGQATKPSQASAAPSTLIDSEWSKPFNLSHSGAASNPRIVTLPDGQLQAFWWDRFDGLMTSIYDGKTWTAPALAPISSKALKETPYMMIDLSGTVNAFWLESKTDLRRGIKLDALMQSQLKFGTAKWSFPTKVADSVAAYSVVPLDPGGLGLGHIRPFNSDITPAGVYFKQTGGFQNSGAGSPVDTSIYYRISDPEHSYINLASNGPASGSLNASQFFIAWDNPRLNRAMFSASQDGGKNWLKPEMLGAGLGYSIHPRLASLPKGEGTLRLWEEGAQAGCVLYQQTLPSQPPASVISNTQSVSGGWSEPLLISKNFTTCPQGDSFWPLEENLYWLWGEDSDALTLTNWQPDVGEWTQPTRMAFHFMDDEIQQSVSLDHLHAALSNDQIAVIGTDPSKNEVWVTTQALSNLNISSPEPSAWTDPNQLSIDNAPVGFPSVGIDPHNRTHVIWSVSGGHDVVNEPGVALEYARGEAGKFTRAVEIVPAVKGKMADQPALLVQPGAQGDSDLLHLVWSGEADSQIVYSRATAEEAISPGGWLPPVVISTQTGASWPQIGRSAVGLHVLYAVPLNEGRGIYLVNIQDIADKISQPVKVFDAAAAGWPMVKHPTFSVGADGTMRAAWVKAGFPGMNVPQGIFYSRSADLGQTWSVPIQIAEEGYDWPRLAVAGGQVHLMFSETATGKFYFRTVPVDQQDQNLANWSVITSVPGYQNAGEIYNLAETPDRLYLVVANLDPLGFWFSVWNDNKLPGSWSPPEKNAFPQDINTASQALQPTALTIGVAAEPSTGLLAVSGLATGKLLPIAGQESTQPVAKPVFSVYLTNRSITAEKIPVLTVYEPTPVVQTDIAVVPTAEPSAATLSPTPAPPVSQAPLPAETTISPLILGGGLAALIVASIFMGYILWIRRRS